MHYRFFATQEMQIERKQLTSLHYTISEIIGILAYGKQFKAVSGRQRSRLKLHGNCPHTATYSPRFVYHIRFRHGAAST
jgi:hypothetical protein